MHTAAILHTVSTTTQHLLRTGLRVAFRVGVLFTPFRYLEYFLLCNGREYSEYGVGVLRSRQLLDALDQKEAFVTKNAVLLFCMKKKLRSLFVC
jgi:hypothetical protein